MAQLVEHILGKDEVTGSTPVSSSSEGAKVTLLHFFESFIVRKILILRKVEEKAVRQNIIYYVLAKAYFRDGLPLRFSQKVTQAELFASARFTRICKTSPFLSENAYCRFLSFMACGGKTLSYSRKRFRRFLFLRQVFPYSQKAGFLRVLASLAYYRTVPFNFVLTVIEF